MKKIFTPFILLISLHTFSQSWTSSDEVVVGDSVKYYLMDSTLSNYANQTGSGQTWDYSNASTYSYDALIPAEAASGPSSPYANFFPNASHDEYFDQTVHIFYSLSGTERTWYGMQLYDDNQGDLLVKFDSFPDRTYPIGLGTTKSTVFSNAEVIIYPNSTSPKERRFPADGSFEGTCDGSGTLIIGDSTFTDVLRYYRKDSISADLGVLGKAKLVRKQHTYLKAGRKFPLFIFTDLNVTGAVPVTLEYIQVLSQVKPKISLGLEAHHSNEVNISVNPNPAQDHVVLNMDQKRQISSLRIMDQSGRQVNTPALTDGKVDISTLPEGLYHIMIQLEDGGRGTATFIKKYR